MTKVLMLCQGLVYDPKSVSVETPGVLALRSGARRYSNELLRNRCASGTVSVDGSGGVDAPPSPARWFCPPVFIILHCWSTFSWFPCGAAAPVTPSPSEEDIN